MLGVEIAVEANVLRPARLLDAHVVIGGPAAPVVAPVVAPVEEVVVVVYVVADVDVDVVVGALAPSLAALVAAPKIVLVPDADAVVDVAICSCAVRWERQ